MRTTSFVLTLGACAIVACSDSGSPNPKVIASLSQTTVAGIRFTITRQI